jgi:hypothetical protein
MVSCIVLNGWHKGHQINLPDLVHTLSLIRPEVITMDYCCDGEEFSRAPTKKHEYKLAFYSVDRKTALYSTDGDSKSIMAERDWIIPRDKNWGEQPLYVGMHDRRSENE